MSDHTIIDTSTMTGKEKFSFRNLSKTQKGGIIGGGIALTAAFGTILSSLLGSDSPSTIGGGTSEATQESMVPEHQEVDVETNDISSISESERVVEEDTSSEAVDTNEVLEESYNLTFDTDVNFSSAVNNDMAFDDAFSSARSDVGYGGWFNWNEQSYSTFTKEEWNEMTEEQQNSFVDEVISQSDVENAQWVESQEYTNDDSIGQDEIEEEYIINDDEIELEDEVIADDTVEVVPNVEMKEVAIETTDDLSEDIIIVKPIRGADVNEDGVVDAIVFDNDGDGNIDLVALDEDYDGTFETYMINEDGDEDLDVFVIDEGGDGIDDSDPMEEISDIVNMEDFVVLDEDQIPEDLSFMDDIFGGDDTQEDTDTIDEDLGLDEVGL